MSVPRRPCARGVRVLRAAFLSPDELAEVAAILPAGEPELTLPAGRARLVPVSAPALDGNELAYVTDCVRQGWISSVGPFVRRFEEAFADAAGTAHAISCSSGTAALHLLTAALGLGPGDEVIVPAFTMVATANAVAYTGAEPVLADSEPWTWNIDPEQVEAKVGPRTKGIILVHTYGQPADVDALRAIAERHGLFLLEDAAEAHGARWRSRPVGSLANGAAFSFYGNKIITTGEGGMVTTDDAELAAVVRRLRDHAFDSERHFWHNYVGFNYRLSSLQAAVGLAQVERLEALLAARRELARRYDAGLGDIAGLRRARSHPLADAVPWMYGLRVDEELAVSRDELRALLAVRGIETRSFFVPLHLQPVYRHRFRPERYPVAEDLCRRGFYLPTGPAVSADDAAYVVAQIRAVLERAPRIAG